MHRAAEALLLASALLVAGCASDRHEMVQAAAPPLDMASARSAYEAMTESTQCRACLAQSPGHCATAREFPLVAAVSGARVVKDFSTCARERPPHPNDRLTCVHFTSLQFDAVGTLAGAGADRTQTFREHYVHDYWTPEIFEGVSLNSGERYIVFARRADDGETKADWDIGMACKY